MPSSLESIVASNFVNGAPQHLPSGRSLPVFSPWNGARVADLTITEDIDGVVESARSAFASWQHVVVKDRVQVLFRFKQLVEAHMDELAELVSLENGKTKAEAKAGIEKGLEVVEFACSLPQLINGQHLEVSQGVDCHTRRFPLGVVAGITPFNFPAMVPMWMFPIAIACGNTFILKPSEQVPLTPLRLAELLTEAGLPPGVFNIVQGDRETVEALLDHKGIDACAFVGSTKIARLVYNRGIAAGKRMLTLGGAKNHLIVMPDADIEVTARNVVSSFTGCAGQRCMAASVLVAVGSCDKVIDAIIDVAKTVRPGKEMGAVISSQAKDRIVGYIDQAAQEGASLKLDGRSTVVEGKTDGFYVGATVIDRISLDASSVRDEIFGPVLSILRVDTLDQALEIERSSPYGNAASIYTSSGATARYFENAASAGMIGINVGVPVPREPFSFGGWNESKFGIGDITGLDGISFWTKTKKVTTKWASVAARNWMS